MSLSQKKVNRSANMEDKIENEKRHKYLKMQGMQICDDTGYTKSKGAQISKNARDAIMR